MWVARTPADIRAIARYTGALIVGMGLAMLVPLVTGLVNGEWDPALDYLFGAGVTLAVGTVMMRAAPPRAPLGRSNAMLVTAASWLVASVLGALPLVLSGNYLSYLDGVFDCMSGFTTSGLTTVFDLDHMSHAHNMWRHLTHLIGGQGIVVAALSVAVASRAGGAWALYEAEGRDERILPNVIQTARFIWFVTAVYVSLGTISIAGVNLYRGMAPMRAVLHAFWATAACFDTGGFGPQSLNALYYHSPAFEFLTVTLMIAGVLNFNLHADVWRGDLGELRRNVEVRFMAFNISLLGLAAALSAVLHGVLTRSPEIIRKVVYHVFSAHTGTGHQTIYAADWRQIGGLGFAVIIMAMAFGGMASSTAGGIKALRLALILKGVLWRIQQALAPPSAIVRVRYHHMVDRLLSESLLSRALMVFFIYVVTYITGGVIGAAYGNDAGAALFESVSAAANVGLSTGITGPHMPTGLKLVYIIEMWIGRLEFVAVFALVAAFFAGRGRRTRR